MRISDWSSDVCSSDLLWEGQPAVLVSLIDVTEQVRMRRTELMLREAIDNLSDSFILYDSDQRVVLTNRRFHETLPFHPPKDERSEERRVGKRVSVRVDLGGRRIIKKTNTKKTD